LTSAVSIHTSDGPGSVFIWTHFALDDQSELITSEIRGSYQVECGAGDLSGGLGTLSCRLTLGSLMHCLGRSGLQVIEACEIDMTHPSGPGVLF
jgi:hypothetical protein